MPGSIGRLRGIGCHVFDGLPNETNTALFGLGTGVRIQGTARIDTQGSLQTTGNSLDMALDGNGYFQVQLPSGDTAYTRDGTFGLHRVGRHRVHRLMKDEGLRAEVGYGSKPRHRGGRRARRVPARCGRRRPPRPPGPGGPCPTCLSP